MRFRNILKHVPVSDNLRFLRGTYKYKPLPSPTSIRLLKLVPSSDRGVVACSLATFELDKAPPFHCLSYTWGEPRSLTVSSTTDTQHSSAGTRLDRSLTRNHALEFDSFGSPKGRRRHISCDDQRMKVSSNLRDALKMLVNFDATRKMPKLPQWYWIDAICMNQQDISERNAQVARMADIFRAAQQVLVWLGKEDEFTRDAITTIERVSSLPEEEWQSVPYTSIYEHSPSQPAGRPNVSLYNWLGFMALISRSWFNRAWVGPPIICSIQAALGKIHQRRL